MTYDFAAAETQARSLLANGDAAAARRAADDLVAARRAQVPADPERTIAAEILLARVLHAQGSHAGATGLLSMVGARCRERLIDQHPLTREAQSLAQEVHAFLDERARAQQAREQERSLQARQAASQADQRRRTVKARKRKRIPDLFTDLLWRDDPDVVERLFDEQDDVLWIDWKEDDADIVALVAARIPSPTLTAAWEDETLVINHAGGRHALARPERDATLHAVAALIQPDHELRFISASEGGDTLAFAVLATADWAALAREFGPRLDDEFVRVTGDRTFFG